eukprot:3940682-Rhodomonas_salina.1
MQPTRPPKRTRFATTTHKPPRMDFRSSGGMLRKDTGTSLGRSWLEARTHCDAFVEDSEEYSLGPERVSDARDLPLLLRARGPVRTLLSCQETDHDASTDGKLADTIKEVPAQSTPKHVGVPRPLLTEGLGIAPPSHDPMIVCSRAAKATSAALCTRMWNITTDVMQRFPRVSPMSGTNSMFWSRWKGP